MRFAPTIFAKLVEPIDRRRFDAIVARHGGDGYDKSFFSWDHLLTLIFAQLSDLDSLRALEVGWNANAQHHYHLGCGALSHSTLSDANKRRQSHCSPTRSKRSPSVSTANAEATAATSSG
jgi:putative transposase